MAAMGYLPVQLAADNKTCDSKILPPVNHDCQLDDLLLRRPVLRKFLPNRSRVSMPFLIKSFASAEMNGAQNEAKETRRLLGFVPHAGSHSRIGRVLWKQAVRTESNPVFLCCAIEVA
jgi:hypothetical protein